jgi:hypothetical protein
LFSGMAEIHQAGNVPAASIFAGSKRANMKMPGQWRW